MSMRQKRWSRLAAALALAVVPCALALAGEPKAEKADETAAAKSGEPAQPPAAERKTPAKPSPLAAAAAKNRADLPTKKDPKTGEEVIVVDNRLLEKLFGPSQAAPPPEPSGPANKWWLRNKRQQPQQGGTDKTQERIRQIEQELARLRQNRLALHNPLLPRPQLNEDEAKKQSGMDNVQRLRQTEKRIQELEAELAKLRQKAAGGG